MSYTYLMWPREIRNMNTAMEASIECSAGEYVYINCVHAGGQIRSVYSTFSGMLLRPLNQGNSVMASETALGG